jgi:large subunit ribosomal protein L15
MPLRAHDLRPPKGAKQPRKRVGRGDGAGTGTYSGRGLKGQNSRAGGGVRPGFEGGQLPLIRRMASKRGFTPFARIDITPINLFRLNTKFEADAKVDSQSLAAAGLIKNPREPFKILASGTLDRSLVIRATRVSPAARAKIEAAGGRVEEPDAESTDRRRSD